MIILAVQVERRAAGDEQQRIVLKRALGMEADGARGVVPIMESRLVELVIIGLLNIRAALFPNGRHGVDGLELLVVLILGLIVVAGILGTRKFAALAYHHLDGIAHVVAVAGDELAQAPLGKIGVVVLARLAVLALGVLANGQDDIGAVLGALAIFDGVALKSVALPHVRRLFAKGAAHHANL